MKKALITIILVTNVFVTSCLAQKQIDLTYIANAGFFVECNGKQVLIDALFKEGWGSYLTPTNEVISKIIGKQAPFTNSNLLLITHDHGDHFDAAMVEDYLKNNTKNMLVAPSQVINALLKNPDNQKLRSQMVELNKSNSAIFDLTIQGIRIRSFFIQHDTRPIIENFGYLIDIDGIKIFHSGDNTGADSIEYEKLALQNDKIDLAILGFYGFWSTEEERAFTKKYINPKNITLMHIPPAEVRMVKDSVNTIKNFIDITVFENSLDKKSFIFK
ncbi:MAG: MBL fold metallo-hydrolase [Bacteroidales bacterium]|nr:MBL fold metallo-hydrolase [Bacteroidales bacterium]